MFSGLEEVCMKTHLKESKVVEIIAYLYIMLPFLIFAVGWMGKRFWIPIVFVLIFSFYKICKEMEKSWIPELHRENILKIVFIITIIGIWVYYSGIGRLVFQNADHTARNAIFDVLVQYEWPVINYDVNLEMMPKGTTATSLVYYIGFWLPSAVIGKIFGLEAGYGFQIFWAILGITLVYYLLCERYKKLLVWPLLILIFFSGLDVIGYCLSTGTLQAWAGDAHIEWWVGQPYQYSSVTTQLFWVFNQAIPAWLCTMLAWKQKNNRSIVVILACCMLPSTFGFVGLLLLVCFWMFTRKYETVHGKTKKERISSYTRSWIKDTFTIQNVLGGGVIGIFSFLYLSINVSGNMVMEKKTLGAAYTDHPLKYFMFIILEIGIYFLLLYKYQKKNSFYYYILINLLMIPFFKIGAASDFCMRASIPALFILMVLVMDTLIEAKAKKDVLVLGGLILTLLIGSVTPIHEIGRTFRETIERLYTEDQVYEQSSNTYDLLNSGNFSGATDFSFFFKYIVK